MRSKVRHCACSSDPKFTIFIEFPRNGFGKLSTVNGIVDELAGCIFHAVCLRKFFCVGALCNIKNEIGRVCKCGLVNVVNSLRHIDAFKSKAITERIRADRGYGIGKNYFLYLGYVEEGKNTYALKLTTLFKYDLVHVLCITESVIADRSDILANHDLFDLIAKGVIPGLLSMGCEIGHFAGTGDLQRAVGIHRPSNAIVELFAAYYNDHAFAQLVFHAVIDCVNVAHGILSNLKHDIFVGSVEYVRPDRGYGMGNEHGFQRHAMKEGPIFNRLKRTAFFKSNVFQRTAFIESVIAERFNTCRNGNAGQTPVVSKRAPSNRFEGGVISKNNGSQVLEVVEAESADLDNAASDLKSGYCLFIILRSPSGVKTVCRIILHHTFTINLQQAIVEKDIHNICTAEACINNRSIFRRNECALFTKSTRVTQNFNFATDSNTVCIVEINLGVNINFTCGKSTCGEITVSVHILVKEEAVELCFIFADTVVTEIIVITVDILKPGLHYAVLVVGFAVPAVCDNDTVNISFTVGINTIEIFTTNALKNSVNNGIGVSGCGNNSSPHNWRVTSLTECSTDISILSTSSLLILNCRCTVNMATIPSVKVVTT